MHSSLQIDYISSFLQHFYRIKCKILQLIPKNTNLKYRIDETFRYRPFECGCFVYALKWGARLSTIQVLSVILLAHFDIRDSNLHIKHINTYTAVTLLQLKTQKDD